MAGIFTSCRVNYSNLKMKKIKSYLGTLRRSLWIRGMADAEALMEIESHLIEAVEQGLHQGLSLEESEQCAMERFGSVQSIVGSFEKERMNTMNKVLLIVAVLCGLFLTYVDASPNWDDTGVIAISLLISAGLITVLGHPRPWLIALAAGLWIPLRYIFLNQDFSMLLVLLFPLIGAYAGWAVRLGVRKTLHFAK
jgi:hypothetical protein